MRNLLEINVVYVFDYELKSLIMAHHSTLVSFRNSLLLLLILGFNQLNYSQVQSSCDIPPELELNYSEDVKEMVLQRIQSQNSIYKDSIEIPQAFQDSIWQGLASIYNAFSIPERDTVYDIFCVHWDQPYELSYVITIGITEDCSWYENWENLNITTGIQELDDLLAYYGFSISAFSLISDAAYLETDKYLNLRALCDSLASFEQIEFAQKYSDITGDGNQINYVLNEDGAEYSFKIGFDDCPSGCQSHYTYHFQVYDDCSVSYLGETHADYGEFSIFPEPSYCNITNTSELGENEQSMEIYPNPAHESFSILSDNNHSFMVEIYSLTGKMIKSEMTNNSHIDIVDLKTGVYLVKIHSQNESPRTLKLFKTQH